MLNQQIAEIFQRMAEIMEFGGDPNDRYRIRAYANAALAIRDTPESLEKLASEKRLRSIPGVGQAIEAKIEEYIKTGKVKEFEVMRKLIPQGFFEMLEIPFLGPKKVRALHTELGIKNTQELEKAIAAGKVQELAGFGDKSAAKILEGIGMKRQSKGRRSIGTVYFTVNHVLEYLKKCKFIDQVVPAGSFRRCEETVGDIDILATGKDNKKIMEYFKKLPVISKILADGDTKVSILTTDELQIDLRVVKPQLFGSALQYFTGSKMHNVHLRTIAKNRGFKLSEYGFFKGEKLVASKTEEECYKSLGMQYVPPELRTDTGEIEAAYRKELPKLIELADIRGDLHAHSTWTDGTNSIEEMAREAQKRGYEYIAMTDHSPSLVVARGLSASQLKKKKREIDALADKLKIKILFGTEVDILADGSIDYPDDILKNFDVVVASIHSRFNQDNTQRLLKAMDNPYVHIIGHPSGRLLPDRKPYIVDFEKFFKYAAATKTVVEINAQPSRLDLQDIYMREAKRHGCLFSIDTDAHSVAGQWVMELGVRWARRGWIEKKEVVNTLSLKDLQKILKKN